MGESAATLASVWSDISTFFTDGLAAGIGVIKAEVILTAPLVVWVASKVLGQAKGLFKLGGRRR